MGKMKIMTYMANVLLASLRLNDGLLKLRNNLKMDCFSLRFKLCIAMEMMSGIKNKVIQMNL